MANKVLSIYVGNDAIRVAEMQTSNKTVILTNAAEISTPDNSVNDGYLVDISAIAEAIRTSIFGRGFSSKDVIFTINSKKIASKDVEIPYVKQEKKLQQILAANSGEYFPMSNTGDYSFAYSILETFMSEEGRKCRVSAVAAPNDLIKCYYELAAELKFNVKNIDYFGNSVIQLLSMQMTEGRTDLVLQIEKDATFVNVMRGKTLILQRSVPYGKNAVINALMDVKKISEKDAKTLLSNETLLDQHVTEDEYAEAVQYLVSGIGRVVEYHRNKNTGDVLQGIKVFGEGSAIAGIEKILERELGAPVTHFETLAGVQIKGQAALTAEEVLRYLPNIGAVIDPVNLKIDMNASDSFSVDSAQIIKVLTGVFVIAFVIMAGWTTFAIVQNVQAKNKNEELQSNIEAIQDIEQIAQAHDEAQKVYLTLNKFDLSNESDTELVLKLFTDMETKMPTDTFIDNVECTDGQLSFEVCSGYHTYVKNELADTIVTFGRNTEYIEGFKVEDYKEDWMYVLITGIDDEGNPEYLREEPSEEDPEGKLVAIDNEYRKEHKDLDMSMVVRLVQSKYTVSCRLVNHDKAEKVATAQAVLDGTVQDTTENTEGGDN